MTREEVKKILTDARQTRRNLKKRKNPTVTMSSGDLMVFCEQTISLCTTILKGRK